MFVTLYSSVWLITVNFNGYSITNVITNTNLINVLKQNGGFPGSVAITD